MISLNAIEKQFGSRILFDNITIALNPSHRTGLIGPNGAGKSVLMRILAGKESVDAGEVAMPDALRVAYLPQEIETEPDATPLENVLRPFAHVLDYERQIESLELSHRASAQQVRDGLAKIDRLHTDLQRHDAFTLEPKAKALLSGLGVPASSWDEDIRKLSGGFRMRVHLAGLLLQEPDFLMLDEPTNHLDMGSLIWLEKFLARFKGGMLVISHDRDFLNRVTDHTAELKHGRMRMCKGSVVDFFAWIEEHDSTEARRAANLQDKINQAEHFVRRFKSKNTKAAAARSKIKQIERLKEQLPDQRVSQHVIHFALPAATRCGVVPVKFENATIGYSETPVFSHLDLTINRHDKIAVIGPNGAGKSTLLKAIAGELSVASGTLLYGHKTEIRYFAQHRLEQLHPDQTLYDTISGIIGVNDRNAVLSVLGAFLFTEEDSRKKAGVLSGGEKSRLSLATILSNPGNVLLLDEPTNHFDIQSVDRLAEALTDYNGTVIIVSHDEFFISRIANRIIEIRPGTVRDFPGALTQYRGFIEAGFLPDSGEAGHPAEASAQPQPKKKSKQERIRKREAHKQVERRIAQLEQKIQETEATIDEYKTVLHDSANATNVTLLTEISAKLEEQESAYEHLLGAWEAASGQLEEVQLP
ncbi:MAG: ATP-binding cassette domain-containing protein [Chitinivibrionales bacterium]|nr:ATP-binding cassette domain-containing protein [Chitinivibrionales bacterium]